MGDVVVSRHDAAPGVAELMLDRAEALNAVSTAQGAAIASAARELADDPSVRVVVLSSAAEKAFCVGADLKERNGMTDEELNRHRPVSAQTYRSILDLPVPVVAAVHGHALGGGLELALSCDLIVVDETVKLGLPEVTVGVIPGGGGTQLLTRRIGWGRAADLIFSGRFVDAAEAYRLGIADRMVEAGQDRTVAVELATTIAANSPVGVRQAKRAMRHGYDSGLAAGLEIEDAAWRTTAFSGDRKEGVAAFNEKRTPNWPGV